MSSIGGMPSSSSAWAQTSAVRPPPSRETMFAKVDADRSGTVDATELQAVLDKVASSGGDSGSEAATLIAAMDGNSDGSLDAGELDQGLRDLLPPPSSTMEFAQRSGASGDELFSRVDGNVSGDASGGVSQAELGALLQAMDENTSADDTSALFTELDADADGSLNQTEFEAARPQSSQEFQRAQGPGGPKGPPPAGGPRGGGGASGATGSTSVSNDPLDTNGDGTVSAQERMAGELADISSRLAELAKQLQTQYGLSSGTTATSSINVTA